MPLIRDTSRTPGHVVNGTNYADRIFMSGTPGVSFGGGGDDFISGGNPPRVGTEYTSIYGGWVNHAVNHPESGLHAIGNDITRFDGNDEMHFGWKQLANAGNGNNEYWMHADARMEWGSIAKIRGYSLENDDLFVFNSEGQDLGRVWTGASGVQRDGDKWVEIIKAEIVFHNDGTITEQALEWGFQDDGRERDFQPLIIEYDNGYRDELLAVLAAEVNTDTFL